VPAIGYPIVVVVVSVVVVVVVVFVAVVVAVTVWMYFCSKWEQFITDPTLSK